MKKYAVVLFFAALLLCLGASCAAPPTVAAGGADGTQAGGGSGDRSGMYAPDDPTLWAIDGQYGGLNTGNVTVSVPETDALYRVFFSYENDGTLSDEGRHASNEFFFSSIQAFSPGETISEDDLYYEIWEPAPEDDPVNNFYVYDMPYLEAEQNGAPGRINFMRYKTSGLHAINYFNGHYEYCNLAAVSSALGTPMESIAWRPYLAEGYEELALYTNLTYSGASLPEVSVSLSGVETSLADAVAFVESTLSSSVWNTAEDLTSRVDEAVVWRLDGIEGYYFHLEDCYQGVPIDSGANQCAMIAPDELCFLWILDNNLAGMEVTETYTGFISLDSALRIYAEELSRYAGLEVESARLFYWKEHIFDSEEARTAGIPSGGFLYPVWEITIGNPERVDSSNAYAIINAVTGEVVSMLP